MYPLMLPFRRSLVSFSKTASTKLAYRGESGTAYRLICPLGTQKHGKASNIWIAVNDSIQEIEYVAKRPSENDDSSKDWPAFRHELKMQRLFAKDPMIRSLVDFVPASEPGGPMMILQAFQETLWDARNIRPFTAREIKWVMKGVLLGIYTVHMKGLVYTDLKMENVGLQGFDADKPNENIRELIVRLADCGSITEPSSREITSLSYRSPEVHFGKPWTQSTDVWSWGIILAQLLLAQVDFKSPGMYDSIATGSLEEKTKAVRNVLAIDFDLRSVPYYAEDDQCCGLLPPPQPDEAYMWANTMVEKGVAGEDVQFLVQVLHPDPNDRLTVREVLESGYLDE